MLRVVLLFLGINPLFRLVQTSLEDPESGAFTPFNDVALTTMRNSILRGASGICPCLIFAAPIAKAITRIDMRAERLPCTAANSFPRTVWPRSAGSDRVEAMVTPDGPYNEPARLEQTDDPPAFYDMWKPGFVAGFISRTNFLDGAIEGGQIAFEGFTVPAVLVPDGDTLSGNAGFSIWPQAILIERTQPRPRPGMVD
jgi:hypothetical protein